MPTWATFSITDNRMPAYRQALALFDKIVVPIPPAPIGDQTHDELVQLEVEVEYLAKHDAAELYEWDQGAFAEWRRPFLAEAMSAGVNRDIFHDTRLMVAQGVESEQVQAIPVYGGRADYDKARGDLMKVEEALTLQILQRLPVPAHDTPLENLIRLRQQPAFRTALTDLLEWKRLRVPLIVLDPDRKKAIAAAMSDFDTLTKAYAAAMESEGYKKAGTVGSIFFSLVTGDVVNAIKNTLVSCREVREPCWKKISKQKCAPGGVVYNFEDALH